jgi:sugar phosphate isomerase/epimerase
MQIGLDLVYWQSVAPREELLKLAVDCGCDAVNLALTPGLCDPERPEEVAATRRAVESLGLSVPSVTVPRHVGALPGAETEFREAFARVAEVAAEFSTPVIAVWPRLPEGVDKRVAQETLAGNLTAVLPLAEPAGCVIALEFEPGVTIERYEESMEFVDRLGPRVKLTVDTYHVHRAGDDLYRAAVALGDRIADVHISGSHRGEPGSAGDACDYAGFVRGLRETGYGGAAILQYGVPPDPPASLRRAVTFTRRVFEEES